MNRHLTLRAKLLYLTIFVMVSFCLSLSIYLKTHFSEVLSKELLKRGVSIASHVAEVCANAFIERDYIELETLAREHKAAEEDIVYILILNRDNKIVAHTFTDGHPLDLEKIVHSINGKRVSVQQINFGEMPLYDIATPVLDKRIGSVRVGISAVPVYHAVSTMTGQIIGAIVSLGILALLLSLPALQTIIKPITDLTHAAKAISEGNWDHKLPVNSNDELGTLTESFNHMINDIRLAEKKLAAHANFLQVLIDDIPLPVFYKDLHGTMLGCNHAYSTFWGKPKQEIVGCHTRSIYTEEEAQLHLSKDQEVIGKLAPLCYEHSVVDAKGQTRHVLFNKALYCDVTGGPAGIIGVIQDVTEQRRSDRMKNEFVSTVAHEFQTPLATILGFVELLQEGVLKDKDQNEAFNMITKKAEDLSEMVDELLDLARIETGEGLKIHLEPCNTNEVLAELIDNFEKRTESHQFSLELPKEDVLVSADKVRMGQVMENLLSNAVKYSARQSKIKVSVTKQSNHCQVQVADQGIGMTEQQKDKIFEKYYRVDTSNTAPSGTGLGLYITKSIIDAHKGQIEVESTPGKGTTVTFRVPMINA